MDKLTEYAAELQSLAQMGLFYGKDVYDRERYAHNKPRYAYGVVKIFYLCEDLGGEFRENSETTGAQFFAPDCLPRLAEEKCNEEQILMCFRAMSSENWVTLFD